MTQEVAWVKLWHRHPARALHIMREFRKNNTEKHFGARQYLATALEGYGEERLRATLS